MLVNTLAGDVIIVSGANSGATTVSGVTDSQSNVYTNRSSSSAGTTQSIWTADSGNNASGTKPLTGGTDTITVTFSATNTNSKCMVAAGASGYGVIDVVPTSTNGTSTTPSISSGALAQVADLVVTSFGIPHAGGAPSAYSGCTQVATVTGGGGEFLSMAFTVSPTAASVTASCTIVSSNWSACMVSFKLISQLAVPAPIIWTPGQFPQFTDFNTNIRDAILFTRRRTVFRGYQVTPQSIPNSAWTGITIDTILEDSYGGWTSLGSQYLAQEDGLYMVTVCYCANIANAAGNAASCGVSLSGSGFRQGEQTPIPNITNWVLSAQFPVYLRAGIDSAAALAWQTSGAAANTVSNGIGLASSLEVEWVCG